jgi:hypothetical protein
MEDWVCWVTAQKAAPNPTYTKPGFRLRGKDRIEVFEKPRESYCQLAAITVFKLVW